MIFNAELNGVKFTKDIPTDWSGVTFRQFLQLKDNKDLTALSVFTGLDRDTLKKAKVKNFDDVIRALSFTGFQPDLFKLPKSILNYPVRQDLGFEPFGRYTDIKDIIDKGVEGEELLKQYPLFCAIYTHQGEYSYQEAEKNVEQFYLAPCTEVLALGNFLLMRLAGLRKGTAKTSPYLPTPLKKLRLALLLWRSRLAFTLRYYIWKRKHLSTGKN